jgi:hypothetical protein
LTFLLPFIVSESSIFGNAGYRPVLGLGYNHGYNYGYNQVYNDRYNPRYNQVYRSDYNPGYRAGYNQGVEYNYPTLAIHQEKPIQPAFNSVPAVPDVFADTSFQENSILPEPIFGVQKPHNINPVPHAEADLSYNALPDIEPINPPHSVAAYAQAPDSAESSQYHAQDEYGNHEYGYKNVNSAKHEVGSAHGGVMGSYSWRDEAGYHTVNYVADENGYRVVE